MKIVLEATEKIVDYYRKAKEKQEISRDIYIKSTGSRKKKLHHSKDIDKDNSGDKK